MSIRQIKNVGADVSVCPGPVRNTCEKGTKMKVSEFNYDLPEELIAQHPYDKRDEARLMVINPKTKKIEHKVFRDVIQYLEPR